LASDAENDRPALLPTDRIIHATKAGYGFSIGTMGTTIAANHASLASV